MLLHGLPVSSSLTAAAQTRRTQNAQDFLELWPKASKRNHVRRAGPGTEGAWGPRFLDGFFSKRVTLLLRLTETKRQ